VPPALKNNHCLSAEGASLSILAGVTTNVSHETGVVLTFFAYFFVSRQKSKWGLKGAKPLLVRKRPRKSRSDAVSIAGGFIRWKVARQFRRRRITLFLPDFINKTTSVARITPHTGTLLPHCLAAPCPSFSTRG
jgi:hypothetical protein